MRPSRRRLLSWVAVRNHWYHGDLQGRALALCAALTGNIGVSGGGFSVYVGQYKVRVKWAPRANVGDAKAKTVASIYFLRGPMLGHASRCPVPEGRVQRVVLHVREHVRPGARHDRLYETLDALDLIVVVDHQITDTACVCRRGVAGDHLV